MTTCNVWKDKNIRPEDNRAIIIRTMGNEMCPGQTLAGRFHSFDGDLISFAIVLDWCYWTEFAERLSHIEKLESENEKLKAPKLVHGTVKELVESAEKDAKIEKLENEIRRLQGILITVSSNPTERIEKLEAQNKTLNDCLGWIDKILVAWHKEFNGMDGLSEKMLIAKLRKGIKQALLTPEQKD